MACMRGCIVTLVAFVRFADIVSTFQKTILQFQVFIFKRIFHFQPANFVVLSLMVASNWGKYNLFKVVGQGGQKLKVKGSHSWFWFVHHLDLDFNEDNDSFMTLMMVWLLCANICLQIVVMTVRSNMRNQTIENWSKKWQQPSMIALGLNILAGISPSFITGIMAHSQSICCSRK